VTSFPHPPHHPDSQSPIPFSQDITDNQAYELSILTGTQVLLLVVSETGLVYTFTTTKLQPLVQKPEGKNLIQVRLMSLALASALLSLLLALASASLLYYIFISYSYSCFHSSFYLLPTLVSDCRPLAPSLSRSHLLRKSSQVADIRPASTHPKVSALTANLSPVPSQQPKPRTVALQSARIS